MSFLQLRAIAANGAEIINEYVKKTNANKLQKNFHPSNPETLIDIRAKILLITNEHPKSAKVFLMRNFWQKVEGVAS